MKKRWIGAVLSALALAGCAQAPQETQPETVPQAVVYTYPEETTETTETTVPEPKDSDFVRVLDYIPEARQELAYATANNFTGTVIYDFTDAWLRYGTVKKLKAVSEDLSQLGLGLKIWDAFRPFNAQKSLWIVFPNSAYVANPANGLSPHCRGSAVDLTLVDADGNELEMPTGFDDFSAKADRDYSDCTPEAAQHAQLLEILMEKHGFVGYSREWWHFADEDAYPVDENFIPPRKS